jgi:hypothetical protein
MQVELTKQVCLVQIIYTYKRFRSDLGQIIEWFIIIFSDTGCFKMNEMQLVYVVKYIDGVFSISLISFGGVDVW